MLRLLSVLAAGCLSLTAGASPAIAQTQNCGDGIIVNQVERPNVSGFLEVEIIGEVPDSLVNVRAEPTLKSEVVLQVRVGDRFFASTRQYVPNSGGAAPDAACELWYFVQATEPLGWVRGDLIGVENADWSRQMPFEPR